MNKIAVIGAGASGLTFAEHWPNTVTVFEKSRGVGGRMSTRRKEALRFDHGLPYFLTPIEQSSHIQQWQDHYVSVPQANSWCKEKAKNLSVQTDFKVELLKFQQSKWWICSLDKEVGPFDIVVLTAPPVQTYELLPVDFAFKKDILSAQMKPCFTLMITCKKPLSLEKSYWNLDHPRLSRIFYENSKPQRDLPTACFVAHSQLEWAEKNLENDREEVQKTLLADFLANLQLSSFDIESSELHCWRYAITARPLGADYLWDEKLKIGVCGDWLLGATADHAVASAKALSAFLATHIR